MQNQPGEKIEFFQSNNFMLWWSRQAGEICRPDIAVSMNRAPPPVRHKPPVEVTARKSVEVPARKKDKEDPYITLTLGIIKAVETVSGAIDDFQAWTKSPPPPPPPPKLKTAAVRTVPPFDIQQIPDAMRKIAAPVGAAIMERWFAGRLNYSPTPANESDGINQNGLPYPPDMIDTTTIKIEWVMKYARAKRALEELLQQLHAPRSLQNIAAALSRYRSRQDISAWRECNGDIVQLHNDFQFQFVAVEGSFTQKLRQFAIQSLYNAGVPDDLTCALGSFNLYAAIAQATFNKRSNSNSVTVTHISVYVKDNYTFTDKSGKASQYLGHWNRSRVAIVPAQQAAVMANIGWLDYAVTQGDVYAKDAVLYPVKNSDFRAWQKTHNQGGDFILYTDRMHIRLDNPITVTI